MRRFFSMFLGGWPGLGLLLLRATVGFTAAVQGGICLADSDHRTFGMWAVGVLALAAGVLLLIGLLTSIASVLVGLGSACIALAWVPPSTLNLLDARLATVLVFNSVAILFVGP